MFLLQKPPTELPSEIHFDFSHLSTKSDKNTHKWHEQLPHSEKTTIQSVQPSLDTSNSAALPDSRSHKINEVAQ